MENRTKLWSFVADKENAVKKKQICDASLMAMGQRFVDAWHRAEQGDAVDAAPERLAAELAATTQELEQVRGELEKERSKQIKLPRIGWPFIR